MAPPYSPLERTRFKDSRGLHMLWRVSFVNSSYALACLHVNMIYFPSLPRSSWMHTIVDHRLMISRYSIVSRLTWLASKNALSRKISGRFLRRMTWFWTIQVASILSCNQHGLHRAWISPFLTSAVHLQAQSLLSLPLLSSFVISHEIRTVPHMAPVINENCGKSRNIQNIATVTTMTVATQSSYLSQISLIIFVEKKLSFV